MNSLSQWKSDEGFLLFDMKFWTWTNYDGNRWVKTIIKKKYKKKNE